MDSSITKRTSLFNVKALQTRIDFLSKICLVATAAAIPVSVAATNIFILATILLSLCREQAWIQLKNSWNSTVVKASLLFLLICAMSILYTQVSWDSGLDGLHKYAKLLYIPLLFPLFSEEKWKTRAIHVFIIAMLITLALSYMKYFGWISIGQKIDPDVVFKNHIETSFFLSFAGFLLMHQIFLAKKQKWLYGIVFLFLAIDIFFINQGRTGYLVFFALMGLFAWQKFRWKGMLTIALILPLLALTIYSVSGSFKSQINIVHDNLEKYQQQKLNGNSIGLRIEFAKNSWELIKQHPLLGTGIGSFYQEYAKQFPNPPGFPQGLNDPHNEYLLVTVQLGILGLISLLWFFYAEWRASFFSTSSNRYFAQGFLIAMMVGCLCDSFIYLTTVGHFFVYFSALFFAVYPKKELS